MDLTEAVGALSESGPRPTGIDLYRLPLGAGGNFVHLNGRIYEAITARLQGRRPCPLYLVSCVRDALIRVGRHRGERIDVP
jgi:hypothetical protein